MSNDPYMEAYRAGVEKIVGPTTWPPPRHEERLHPEPSCRGYRSKYETPPNGGGVYACVCCFLAGHEGPHQCSLDGRTWGPDKSDHKWEPKEFPDAPPCICGKRVAWCFPEKCFGLPRPMGYQIAKGPPTTRR